ncbi:uncharacterized protein LOC126735175 [Anthonomus grandis grandis]|uniref:uncharacterized protein LOC126735175 n=1 Tax=Anthonomus grandis grandis TaxID=2921223 RepID=UPI0021651740|nr:uncharacterized protein LOC126735175 [Anthonomus grandis grandis]
MVVKQILVCLALISLCDGLTINLANSKLCLTRLRLKIEANITSTREYVSTQLMNLDELISHLALRIDAQVNITKTIVNQMSNEALSANKSIKHCIIGLKSLSQNLDMYSLKSCKYMPTVIEDLLFEAKNLSRSLMGKKSDCLLNNDILNIVKINLCIQDAYSIALTEAEAIFEKLIAYKAQLVDEKLKCIEQNFNIISSELCLLSCQFKQCATKNCRSIPKNNWISEALNQTSILT